MKFNGMEFMTSTVLIERHMDRCSAMELAKKIARLRKGVALTTYLTPRWLDVHFTCARLS
jgi:hypothetical protein